MDFDPNDIGVINGNFIGLPKDEANAKIVLLGIPWDVTTSYRSGTSRGPENILEASYQLDLYDVDYPDTWKRGIFYHNLGEEWLEKNDLFRKKAQIVILSLIHI